MSTGIIIFSFKYQCFVLILFLLFLCDTHMYCALEVNSFLDFCPVKSSIIS